MHVHPYEFIIEGRAGCALKLKLESAGSDRLSFSQLPVVGLSCLHNLGRAGVVPVPPAEAVLPSKRPAPSRMLRAGRRQRTRCRPRALGRGPAAARRAALEARASGSDSSVRLQCAAVRLRSVARPLHACGRRNARTRPEPVARLAESLCAALVLARAIGASAAPGPTTGPASERGGAAALTGLWKLLGLPQAFIRAPVRPHMTEVGSVCASGALRSGRAQRIWLAPGCLPQGRLALMEVKTGRPALPPFIERGAHPALHQGARPPRPQAAAVTGCSHGMCTGLHMRDLLLLRGLAGGPALALDSVDGGVDGEAWVSVSMPQRVCSVRMRCSHAAPSARPSARPCRACAGSPPRSLWQSALAGWPQQGMLGRRAAARVHAMACAWTHEPDPGT